MASDRDDFDLRTSAMKLALQRSPQARISQLIEEASEIEYFLRTGEARPPTTPRKQP